MANSLLASSVSLPLIDSTISFGSFIQYYFAYVVICFLSTQLRCQSCSATALLVLEYENPSPTRQLQCIRQLNIEGEAGNHAGVTQTQMEMVKQNYCAPYIYIMSVSITMLYTATKGLIHTASLETTTTWLSVRYGTTRSH